MDMDVSIKQLPSAALSDSNSDDNSDDSLALLNYNVVPLPFGWERNATKNGKGFWYICSEKKGQRGQKFHPYDPQSKLSAADTFIKNPCKAIETINTSTISDDEPNTAAAAKKKRSRATSKEETIMMSAKKYDDVIALFDLAALITDLDTFRHNAMPLPVKCVKVDETEVAALYVRHQVAILVRIIECKVNALDSRCDDFAEQYEGIKKGVLENEFQIIFKTNWLRPRISAENFAKFHSLAPTIRIETMNKSGKQAESTPGNLRDNARKKFVEITEDPVFEKELKNQIKKSIIFKAASKQQRAASSSKRNAKNNDTEEGESKDSDEESDEDGDDADDESDDEFFNKMFKLSERKSKESISNMNIPKFEFAVTEIDKRYSSGIFLYHVSEIDRYMLTYSPLDNQIKHIGNVCTVFIYI